MASGNALQQYPDAGGITSGNGNRRTTRRFALDLDQVLADDAAALEQAPLAPASRRKYRSRVRGFLAWLASSDADGDPLDDPAARDWAVRDYRVHLKTVAKASPATINNTLAALGDFYSRRGLGPAAARREDLPRREAPSALGEREARRFLRTVEAEASVRDRVVALLASMPGCATPRSCAWTSSTSASLPAAASSTFWARARTAASDACCRCIPSYGPPSRTGAGAPELAGGRRRWCPAAQPPPWPPQRPLGADDHRAVRGTGGVG